MNSSHPSHRQSVSAPGVGLLALLAPLAWMGDLREQWLGYLILITAATLLLYAGVALLGRRGIDPSRRSILGIALLLRLALLPMSPSLSDDAYRYLWDGRLVIEGVNPYHHIPADDLLRPYHDELYERQGYPTTNTIYPPGAQLIFAAAMAAGEPLGGWWGGYYLYKLLLIAMEMIAILLLLRMIDRLGTPRRLALLYAWHPLVVVELAGQGHTDVFWTLGLALALYGYLAGGAGGGLPGLAIGAVTRLHPLALAPLWIRFLDRRRIRTGMLLALPILLLFIPLLDPVAFDTYATVLSRFTNFYEFNGGFYYLAKYLLDLLHLKPSNAIAGGIGTGLQLLLLLVLWLLPPGDRSFPHLAARALFIVTAQIILGAKVHIWYFVAPLYLLPLVSRHPLNAAWLWGAFIAPFTYLMYAANPAAESMEIVAIEWIGFALFALYGAIRSSRSPDNHEPPVAANATGG